MDSTNGSGTVRDAASHVQLDILGGTPSASSNASDSSSLLPAPSGSVGGSTLMRAMLMVEENLFQQQKAASARKEAADQAEMEASKKAVETMREEAFDTFKQAIVSGSLQMAGAIANGFSALEGIKAGVNDNGLLKAGTANDWSKGLGATGQVLDKGAAAAQMGFGYEIKEDEADKAQHDLDAKAASKRSESYAEFSREVHDLATRTLQKLDEILQARNQTALAIMRA